MKSEEKEGALLHVLSDVIRIPLGQTEAAIREKEEASKTSKKRKRGEADGAKLSNSPTEHSTIIFTATKHVGSDISSAPLVSDHSEGRNIDFQKHSPSKYVSARILAFMLQ